jgi:hypothetical protein
MPIGMILWKWDVRSGAEILGIWPNEVKISNKTLMQLYSQHMYSAKADIVSLFVGSLNLLSIWTGSIDNYFLSLLLQQDEDAENFSAILPDTMFNLIPYIEQETFNLILPSIYQRFVEYPDTNIEQRRAILCTNQLNRYILNLLQDEGVYYKDELKIWLEDSLKKSVFNYEMAIERLSHNGFIKIASVKGVEGTYLFLLNNMAVFRAPPLDISQRSAHSEDSTLYEEIFSKIREYFKYYQPNRRDNLQIVKVLSETNYYNIINFLRKTIATRESLKKLILRGISSINDLLNELINLDIVDTAKNLNNEVVYYLKSDLIVDKIRPDFMMRRIYEMNRDGKKNPALLKEYIKILKENFYDEATKKKERKNSNKRIREIKKKEVSV